MLHLAVVAMGIRVIKSVLHMLSLQGFRPFGRLVSLDTILQPRASAA